MGCARLDPAIEGRRIFFEMNQKRLSEFAHEAIYVRGLRPEDFVVICLNAEDKHWKWVVEMLAPGVDMQKYRDMDLIPSIRGCIKGALLDNIRKKVPELQKLLSAELPEGHVFAWVMDFGGVSIHKIKPMLG